MKYFKILGYIPTFIFLFILFGCDDSNYQNEYTIKIDEDWKNTTINKVMSGYNAESNGFFDYSQKTVNMTIDEIWRSIKIYKMINYNFDEKLISETMFNIAPSSDREKLEYDYICKTIGGEICKNTYYNDYNIFVEELLNRDSSSDNKYETLDALYVLISNFPNDINELSKYRIANWISENEESFQSDIGLLYTILGIEHNLGMEFIEIKDKDKYGQLLTDILNEKDSDLIELYYLYFINVYLQNSYNQELITKRTADYYNTEYGFSLSTNEYIDGNLGSYLGMGILSSLDKVNLLKSDMTKLFKLYEDKYGGFINRESIPRGTTEETIMANYILDKLIKNQNFSNENINLSNLNWYWTYYGLLQYDNQLKATSKKNLLERLKVFEYEVLNTAFTEEVYDLLLTSSGIINEIEYFSKVGISLDYPFDKKYKKKMEQMGNKLINNITINETSVLSSVIALNDIFELNLDKRVLESITEEAIKNNNPNNFYEWYSVIKSANLLGILENQDIDFYKYLNRDGGVYGDLEVEYSDTLFSTFLMLSVIKISE